MGVGTGVIILDKDGNRVAELDEHGALQTIPIEHYMIHAGKHYSCSDYDADVDIATVKYWAIRIPAGMEAHALLGVTTSNAGLMQLFENPTLSGDGTALAIKNSDRNSTNTTTVTAFANPTVGGGVGMSGDLLGIQLIGSANTAQNRIGGEARSESEFILKAGEEYLVRFKADNDNTKVTFNFSFYESA